MNFQKTAMVCAALMGIFSAGCGCTYVEPGHAGIKVNMYGEDKGVDSYPLKTGRVWYNPISETVYEFPTYMQTVTWGRGKDLDESITFSSKEGAVINTDVALNYSFVRDAIPEIFVELRRSPDRISSEYMRGLVRDSLSRHASSMKVTDIFGEGKQQLLVDVKKDLDEELEGQFIIDMIGFVGALRVDGKVENAINATIEATQRAIEAENKVAQSKAEADQKIQQARGEAESIMAVAKAKSEANRVLTQSLSQELLQYEAMQRWDGVLPNVVGGNTVPFIQLQVDKK